MAARRIVIGSLVPLAVVGGFLAYRAGGATRSGGFDEALANRGTVAVLGSAGPSPPFPRGTRLVPAQAFAGLQEVLAGDDPSDLPGVMARSRIDAILVEGPPGGARGAASTIGERLGAYQHVPTLTCAFLSAETALYLRDALPELSEDLRRGLATVARRLLAGADPPRVESFPEPARRRSNVEVMVMVRAGEAPRLWRSARGSSLARALLTAAVAARKRWSEREASMGGRLREVLPGLHVEVSLLREDGTLRSRAPRFIERAITPAHGIGFEHKGAWGYLLPGAVRRKGKGSAVRAYRSLFSREGLAPDSLQRREVRPYRLVPLLLARSPAPSS
jgi:hypothetical protein